MAKKAIPSLQASDGFVLTPSDTLNIVSDPNNTSDAYTFCYVHNAGTSGTVRVLPADSDNLDAQAITVYIAQGSTLPLMVKRVYATSPVPPSPLVAFVSRGGSF